jgi:DNA polymerase III delta prime subunit
LIKDDIKQISLILNPNDVGNKILNYFQEEMQKTKIPLNHRQEGNHMSSNEFFDFIENKTGVKMHDVFKLANSLQNANFQDKKTVRRIVKEVARMANRPVSKEKEDKIVNSIVKGDVPTDLASLSNMLKR